MSEPHPPVILTVSGAGPVIGFTVNVVSDAQLSITPNKANKSIVLNITPFSVAVDINPIERMALKYPTPGTIEDAIVSFYSYTCPKNTENKDHGICDVTPLSVHSVYHSMHNIYKAQCMYTPI